jgi:hypothetical protein
MAVLILALDLCGMCNNFTEERGKILVAYFSKTGTTETIARYIHDKTGGDMFKIETVTSYPANYQQTLPIARQELSANARPVLWLRFKYGQL